ncbi:hypothetical protein H6P81_008043 [Aristolochia fimbriata]|uniref:Wax synthase domain-containing protein n=1 Tax=Aristolochia fimbriata TaxID=158543 RepID=A0AAV7F3A1_ARIFI|nr:hypothetical protein H6P81_008043 [Aristolochia fimbriata]
MEELKSLAKVSISVIAALIYCYFFVSRISPGKTRLLFLLPIFYLFALLPWSFSSIHFRGIAAFFLTWLGIFKLLLYAFGQGPLASPNASFPSFASIASLPVKYKQRKKGSPRADLKIKNPPRLSLPVKVLFLAAIVYCYKYKSRFPHEVLLSVYCLHLYLSLELVLAAGAAAARAGVGLELEPQSDEPYLSTSLQDFWGRRWNLMVTGILRPTVYDPIRRWAGSTRRARLLGIIAVFLVSGLMHEVMFYYLTTEAETRWEVTWFFVLHGFCTAAEVAAKEALAGKIPPPPPAVSRAATLVFVAVTGFWLFFPPIIRSRADVKVVDECVAFLEFFTDTWQNLVARIRLF